MIVEFLLRHRTGALTAILALVADQAAKLLINQTLALGDSWPKEGFIKFTHVTNTGGAFSLFSGYTVTLIVVSVIGLCVLFALYCPRSKTGSRAQFSFGLMFAGAAGNLVDRIFFGHVTDFVDIVPWLTFNVADVAIMLGIIFFACDLLSAQSPTKLRWFP